MVTLDWTTGHHDGVTLVTVSLSGIDEPTRVTVRNQLDGPVWPPRREGLPEAGWTDTGFRGVVGPGSHALGYACPGEPADPPVTLESTEPAPDAATVDEQTDSPADVVRHLGDPSPPADAVPAARSRETGASTVKPDSEPTAESDSRPSEDATAEETASAPVNSDSHTSDLPNAVGPWLVEMARRVDRAEALDAADTVPAATTAVREAGGLAGVRDIATSSDEQRLRVVARRARRLAERRAAADVPVETLSTLA